MHTRAPETQEIPQADMHRTVRRVMDEFGSFVDEHLDPKSSLALQTANIGPEFFTSMRKLFFAIRDPRLVKLGRHAFRIVSNVSATPHDVHQLLKGNIGMNDTEV